MRHPFNPACNCKHCVKESARRGAQAGALRRLSGKIRREHGPRYASRAEQHARYLDCGPQNWDDR